MAMMVNPVVCVSAPFISVTPDGGRVMSSEPLTTDSETMSGP